MRYIRSVKVMAALNCLFFLAILADQAGHSLDMDKLKPKAMLKATIASFDSDEAPLVKVVSKLIA